MRSEFGLFRFLGVFVFFSGPAVSYADSFRCDRYLAREGMPSSELEEKCGRPDVIETSEEPIIVRRPDGTTFTNGFATTSFWYYERGRNQFVARVTIRDSVVEEIELLEARLIESLDLD